MGKKKVYVAPKKCLWIQPVYFIDLIVGRKSFLFKPFGNEPERIAFLGVSVRNFVCELFFKNQGIRSLVCERPS